MSSNVIPKSFQDMLRYDMLQMIQDTVLNGVEAPHAAAEEESHHPKQERRQEQWLRAL